MREHKIHFTGPMVRAILEGRKTQTRRVVKPPSRPPDRASDGTEPVVVGVNPEGWPILASGGGHRRWRASRTWVWDSSPYGTPGDRLWVRETWQTVTTPADRDTSKLFYAADHGARPGFAEDDWRWRPSIHMPRWASRITLEVTGVRVERLQDISADDARAEGVDGLPPQGGSNEAQWRFRSLWDSINGKRASWASNPWVWVIEFRRVEAP